MPVPRTVIRLAAVAAVAAGGVVVAAGPAPAATPACTRMVRLHVDNVGGGRHTFQPGTRSGSRTCVMGPDSSGEGVRTLQNGFRTCYDGSIGRIVADGEYGPRTRQAVIDIQNAWGLVKDGVYGPKTRGAIAWPIYGADGGFTGACFRLSF